MTKLTLVIPIHLFDFILVETEKLKPGQHVIDLGSTFPGFPGVTQSCHVLYICTSTIMFLYFLVLLHLLLCCCQMAKGNY